jgi:hypothetical protein
LRIALVSHGPAFQIFTSAGREMRKIGPAVASLAIVAAIRWPSGLKVTWGTA